MTTPKHPDASQHPIGPLLDSAGSRMLALEESGSFPSELRVSASVYASFAHLRQRELTSGFPLLVLGTTVVMDSTLGPDEFEIAP
jgi:hypothetical protein